MVQLHEADVRSLSDLETVFRSIRPSVVIHLAAHGAYSYHGDAVRMLETNVIGTLNLLTTSEECGVSIFLNAGSSSEYGPKVQPMIETDLLVPDRPYGVSKAAQTLLSMQRSNHTKMAIVTLRLFSVYGPWDDRTKMMPRLLSHARKGLPLKLSSPEISRDFIFVDDVADVFLKFDKLSRFSGHAFNIGTGIGTTFGRLVDYAVELFGSGVIVSWNEALKNPWDTALWCADMTKTHTLLGWKPRYGLREGLELTSKWISERADEFYST